MNFEEWAESVFKFGTDPEYGIAKSAWDAATKSEREACAKICNGVLEDNVKASEQYVEGRQMGSTVCRNLILMRSNVQIERQPRSGLPRSNAGLELQMLTVGEYTIYPFNYDGDFWIRHESGEGMQVFKHNFEKLIDDYYKSEF